jgi:hypothetical protein
MTKRVKRLSEIALNEEQVDWLLWGPILGEQCPFELEDDIDGLWKAHEDELLQIWIKERPGTRPDAWWKISAPESRQALGESSWPLPYPERKWKVAVERETETEFLKRLNLLLPGEAERIHPSLEGEKQFRENRIQAHRKRLASLGPESFTHPC